MNGSYSLTLNNGDAVNIAGLDIGDVLDFTLILDLPATNNTNFSVEVFATKLSFGMRKASVMFNILLMYLKYFSGIGGFSIGQGFNVSSKGSNVKIGSVSQTTRYNYIPSPVS